MSYTSRIENGARAMAASAVQCSTVKVAGVTYTLTFDPSRWVYDVTDPEDNLVVTFNTKKVTVAKTWLREYLAS